LKQEKKRLGEFRVERREKEKKAPFSEKGKKKGR